MNLLEFAKQIDGTITMFHSRFVTSHASGFQAPQIEASDTYIRTGALIVTGGLFGGIAGHGIGRFFSSFKDAGPSDYAGDPQRQETLVSADIRREKFYGNVGATVGAILFASSLGYLGITI
jgi:hypothetical protein